MEDTDKLKVILSDLILNTCGTTFKFSTELNIQCLIGITVDNKNVHLININKSNSKSKNCNNSISDINSASTSKGEQQIFPKVVSERRQTECVAIDQSGGGYAEVQKSMKLVQHPTGLVEQKEMQWKTYSNDGKLIEEKKVEEIQPVENSQVIQDDGLNADYAYPEETNEEDNYEYYDDYQYDESNYNANEESEYYYENVHQPQNVFSGARVSGGKRGARGGMKQNRGRGGSQSTVNMPKLQGQGQQSYQPPNKKFRGNNNAGKKAQLNIPESKNYQPAFTQPQQQQQQHFRPQHSQQTPRKNMFPHQQQQQPQRMPQQQQRQPFHSPIQQHQQQQQKQKAARVRKITFKQNPALVNEAVKMVNEGRISIRNALLKYNLSRADFKRCLSSSNCGEVEDGGGDWVDGNDEEEEYEEY